MKLPQIAPPPLTPGTTTQWIIAAIVALGPFSLTMYQPALPAIAADLNATTGQVQFTLTVYLAFFAIGQLVYGPLSDHFGRRRTLLAGLAIFVAGALACMLARSIEALIAARVLQGFGACAGPALGRAMVRDLYGASGAARAMAFVASALSIAPALAPVFGGYIASWADWQAIFGVLATVGAAMLVFVLLRIPETNPYVAEGAFRLAPLVGSYLHLLRSGRYLGYVCIAATATGGSTAFQTAAPFIIVGEMGVAPSLYGWLLISLTAAYFCGTLIANRLVRRESLDRTLVIGSCLLLVGSMLQLAFALAGLVSVITIMVPQMVWLVGMGITFPSAMAGAVGPFAKMAGAAAALQGFAMMATGAALSLILARLGGGAVSLGAVTFTVAVAGTLVFFSMVLSSPPRP